MRNPNMHATHLHTANNCQLLASQPSNLHTQQKSIQNTQPATDKCSHPNHQMSMSNTHRREIHSKSSRACATQIKNIQLLTSEARNVHVVIKYTQQMIVHVCGQTAYGTAFKNAAMHTSHCKRRCDCIGTETELPPSLIGWREA